MTWLIVPTAAFLAIMGGGCTMGALTPDPFAHGTPAAKAATQSSADPEHSEWTGERVVAILARTGDVVRDQRMAGDQDCLITRTGTADDGRRVIEWQKVSDRTVTFRLLCDRDSLFALVHRAEHAPACEGDTTS